MVVPPLPYWLTGGRVSLSNPEETYRIVTSKKDVIFESNPGPQTWLMFCPYDEILAGGRRGGGKSKALISWMATGDLTLPEGDLARISFLLDPTFRGLFLREEYQS